LLEKHRLGHDIHIFSLDFSSALLAALLHPAPTLELLDKQPALLKSTLSGLLALLRDPAHLATSVLLHVLICLSYLSKERFTSALEECGFVDRISEFVELYSSLNPSAATPTAAAHGTSDVIDTTDNG
jgi:hypothetical protein